MPATVVDFTLTDEQKALREMAHDFAAKEIRRAGRCSRGASRSRFAEHDVWR